MKTRFLTASVVLLLLLTMAAGAAFAQGPVSYSVGVQIKNLDNTAASDVQVVYYNQDGTVNTTFNVPSIPANGSFTMATLQENGGDLASPFDGSAVVMSSNRLAAIANVFGNGEMGASYTAFSGGATTANLPLIMRNHYGFSTWFNVQNTGSSATTAKVTYSNGATEQATIQPGAAHTFNQAGNGNLPDPSGNPGFVGAATVTSSNDVPIVATLMEQGPTTLLGYDGFMPNSASTNPVMPLINTNNYGYSTGIQIQNTGSQRTTVTVTYTPSQAGKICTETLDIAPGSSATFADAAFRTSVAGENCANGATFVGSARVTNNSAGQPLVAIVNQLNSGAQKGASYGAFNPANGTAVVELPLIMDRNYGYWTGFSIVNVGTQATTVTCTYTNSNVQDRATVQPGGALTVQNLNKLGDRYVGAGTCTASGGDAKIVGVVNELGNGYASDSFLVYEGTNR